jgi:cullin 3
LFRSGYQIVLHKHGELLYDGVKKTITDYIKGIREKIMEHLDEVFLIELLAQWEKHRTAIGMIRDILMYMDRNYVPQNKKVPVYDLGIKIFGQEVFHQNTLVRIQRLLMDIIQKDRDGENIADRFLLKNLCQMMIEISKKDIYLPFFEQKFLIDSREYFTKEASLFFEKSTATDYLERVLLRLKQEKERANRCLDSGTKPKIVDVLKMTMIEAYKNRIIEKDGSGCIVMLNDWRVSDLRKVFDVLSLVPGALKPCVALVKQFCTNEGLLIVKEQDEKPIELIENSIKLKERYEELLIHSFSQVKQGVTTRDSDFVSAVKRSFDEIVNENQRFHEYLSLYIDSKLKKGKTQIPESEFDKLFDQAIGLFRHLKDKDIFEKYYKSHLAKRLLSDRSQSDEAEKSFITKLKTEFGYQFTSKLEGMFTDMRVSKETMESYKNYSKKAPIDINVQVLTTGYWPISQSVNCTLPLEITNTCNFFRDFYVDKHTGRKITWQYNMGTADIKANCFSKKYELNVSTFQMLILLLFNDETSLTFNEIAQQTKIPTQDLKKNVLALTVKNIQHDRLLNKDKETTMSPDTVFELNSDFKSKLIKVKISPVVLKESKEQFEETQQKMDEERKWAMDATVVRIMKARKVMEHRDLVLECTNQLQGRFMPSPEQLKKRIESLIEREYLERSKDSRTKYNYLA